MKIAFCVSSLDADADIGARLGRCAAHVVVDTDTGERDVFENPGLREGSSGVKAARFLADQKVTAVVAGMFGAHAADVLHEAGIAMYRATTGSIDQFLQGRERHTRWRPMVRPVPLSNRPSR